MKFTFNHFNINVADLESSIAFYQKALDLHEIRRHQASDKSFTLVYMGDDSGAFSVELTWLADKEGSYELGDNESHLALRADDIEKARALHREMGCICYENTAMGIYFIEDPDGYWVEIIG